MQTQMENPADMLYYVRDHMSGRRMRPVVPEDLVGGTPMEMVDVRRLYTPALLTAHTAKANPAITPIVLEKNPLGPHESIRGRRIVKFRRFEEAKDPGENAWVMDFRFLEDILRNHYDPTVANSSEERFFIQQ